MNAFIYYLGSGALLGASGFLFNRTAPLSKWGCYQYDKARWLRTAAIFSLVTGLLGLGIAVFAQVSASTP